MWSPNTLRTTSSWGSTATAINPKQIQTIRSGIRQHTMTVPPGNEPFDPLTLHPVNKNINFFSLMAIVFLTNTLKTYFVPLNSVAALSYTVPYAAVLSLTAVPLIVAAFSGLVSVVLAKIFGKRWIYLVSALLVTIGATWHYFQTENSFAGVMGGRVFQGLGWGAFDMLAVESINDMYLGRERDLRIAIHDVISVVSLWFPPIVGGRMRNKVIPLVAAAMILPLVTPLAAFSASATGLGDRSDGTRGEEDMTRNPDSRCLGISSSVAAVKKPRPYNATWDQYRRNMSVQTVLQAPRAFVTPTVVFAVAVSFIPVCMLWSLAETVGLLFSSMPFMLEPPDLGVLMVGPLVLAVIAVLVLSFFRIRLLSTRWTPRVMLIVLAVGALLAFTGMVAYGHVIEHNVLAAIPPGMSQLSLPISEAKLNWPLLSALLGILAAGAVTVAAVDLAVVSPSARFSTPIGPDGPAHARTTVDMTSGITFWRGLLAGVFVMLAPGAVGGDVTELKTFVTTVGAVQIGLTAGLAVLWWIFGALDDEGAEHGENANAIWKWDRNVMCHETRPWRRSVKRTGSFFDHN